MKRAILLASCSPNMAGNKKATHSFGECFVLGVSIDSEARDLLPWSRAATVQYLLVLDKTHNMLKDCN